jgi:hypothetical protein
MRYLTSFGLKSNHYHLSLNPKRSLEDLEKATREELTSIKSFKNIKVLKEEQKEFWEKHTFTHKMSHYLIW